MYYEVFPFGKYKGIKLKELPSTYIVFALEQFELPNEMNSELGRILLGRFSVFSGVKKMIETESKKNLLKTYSERIKEYEINE
jgi:uncharacterized protein (DUF3820 family)